MRDLILLSYHDTYNVKWEQKDLFNVFADKLRDLKSVDVLFWNPSEPVGNPLDVMDDPHYKTILYEFENFLMERDIFFYGLYGGTKINCEWGSGGDFIVRNMKVLVWPTFLLHYTQQFLEESYDKPIENININNEFEKLFLFLNRHPRTHRSMIIDYMSKNNLFDYGKISWNKLSTEWQEPFEFQHWKEEILIQDMGHKVHRIEMVKETVDFNTDFILNNKCFVNFVGETLMSNFDTFISEKTFKNILIKQPFISIGSINHNKELERLGFKLYDKIFDYTFDIFKGIDQRVEKSVDNLIKHKNSNLFNLFDLIKNDVSYNKQKALEIVNKDMFIPQEMRNLYNNHKNQMIEYKFIKKDCNIEKIFKNF